MLIKPFFAIIFSLKYNKGKYANHWLQNEWHQSSFNSKQKSFIIFSTDRYNHDF
jgi:hypothetical protein